MTLQRFNALTLLTLLALSACTATKPTESSNRGAVPMQTARQFKFSHTEQREVNYLLFLPRDYDANGDKRWPLILFLHGAGERGSNVWKVAIHGPSKYFPTHPDFPFILLSPQCPEGQIWSNDTVLALLEEIVRNYKVDRSRVYLTGLSMGGYGTWSLGATHPEKFAAIAPICGGGDMISIHLSSRDKEAPLKSLPVWAFHGAKDPVVPLEESQRMVEAMKKVGAKEVKLTIYPEAQHDSWTQTYNNPELYEWFLAHHRD